MSSRERSKNDSVIHAVCEEEVHLSRGKTLAR